MSGSGLLMVGARIIDPATTTEAQFDDFYNNERVPDILNFPTQHRPKQAIRYKLQRIIADIPLADHDEADASHVETRQMFEEFPYIVLYPTPNLAVLYSRMVGKRHAKELHGGPSKAFGGARVVDYIDFQDRMFRNIGRFECDDMEEKTEAPKTLVIDGMDGALDVPGTHHGGFEANYRPPERFQEAPSYRRSTLMKRLDKKVPRYVAMHEFTSQVEALEREVVLEWPEMKAVRVVFELIFSMGDTTLEL